MKKKNKIPLSEIAKTLNIAEGTLYNWGKNRKLLYEIVINHFNNYTSNIEESEIDKYFKELNELEKEMYLSEIKARVLRKKLDS